jgi:SAM-dependent methyltransferase
MARNFLAGLNANNLNIVDAACGLGVGYYYLSPFGKYTGIDSSEEVIQSARVQRPDVNYLLRDLESYSAFADLYGNVDVLVSLETAEHLVDPVRFLHNVRILLNKGAGYFIFSAPSCLTRDYNIYHLHDKTAKQWSDIILDNGFVILYTHEVGFSCTFKQFCGTTPTTTRQKLGIALFDLVHPWYGLDRLYNWIIMNKFHCSSQFFVCQAHYERES